MRLATHHSHLNGLEHLLIHRPVLWAEIGAIISITAATNAALNSAFGARGWNMIGDTRMAVKDRVGTVSNIGRASSVGHSLVAEPLAFYVGDIIDVGIEILPMKELQAEMSANVATYEGELYNLIREGRGVPAVPLVLIGVAP